MKNKLETVDALQEWGRQFRDQGHPVQLTLFRAAAIILSDIQQARASGEEPRLTTLQDHADLEARVMARRAERDALIRLNAAVITRMTADDPTVAERLELLQASKHASEVITRNS